MRERMSERSWKEACAVITSERPRDIDGGGPASEIAELQSSRGAGDLRMFLCYCKKAGIRIRTHYSWHPRPFWHPKDQARGPAQSGALSRAKRARGILKEEWEDRGGKEKNREVRREAAGT